MRILFDVYVRVEGIVDADDPHDALHFFDREMRTRLHQIGNRSGSGVGEITLQSPITSIRCYDLSTKGNLECGKIATFPCPYCEK